MIIACAFQHISISCTP